MKNLAIKEHHLYNKAYKKGRSYIGKLVTVYVLRDYTAEKLKKANPEKKYVNRVGLSVSKKLGGAVGRNRAKRLIRAGFDVVKPRLRTGNLIVIGARGAIMSKKSTHVARELEAAFTALGLIDNGSDA
ncbi:MAG: ribonuclease P protein component [Clostridia bacterium]|nr:ribonuclease P protein component [Clostridia bacterium]